MEHLIEDEFQEIYHKHKKMYYLMQGALTENEFLPCNYKHISRNYTNMEMNHIGENRMNTKNRDESQTLMKFFALILLRKSYSYKTKHRGFEM